MANILRLAFRRLAKTPGFTATALSTLAICLGANLTIFAVVDAVLLRPLPFPEPGRIALVYNSYPGAGVDQGGASIANYFDRRHSVRAFASCSAYYDGSTIVGGSDAPRRIQNSRVTPEFFQTLGVPLAMGTMFDDSNLTYSNDLVAVITNGFWRSYFNADPKVVGRTFLNDGLQVTVIGVLPSGFRFLSSHAEFYRPASHDIGDRAPKSRHNGSYRMIARLAPGATFASAQAELAALNERLYADDPIASAVRAAGYHTVVTDLHRDYVHQVRPMLELVQVGALLLFLIGGVNIANLALIRASGQQKEFSIRQALGARRSNLFLESLSETAVLSLAGAGFGLLLGEFGIRMLPALGTDKLPLGDLATFDWRITAASLAASMVVAFVLALPALIFSRGDTPSEGLRSESRSGTAGRASQRLRHAFIIAQVALAFILLTSAGLLGLSLKRVLETPPGFGTDNLVAGNISLPWKDFKDGPSRLAFVERLIPAIRSLPGVSDAALNTSLPFNQNDNQSAVAVEGLNDRPGGKVRAHEIYSVSADYWRIMGIRLVQGRLLEDADNRRMPFACVVDQAFAERYWPKGDAIGHSVTPFDVAFDRKNCLKIVGIVSDVKQSDLTEADGYGAVYMPFAYQGNGFFTLVVRTGMPAPVMIPLIQKAVRQLDPGLPVDDLRSLQSRIDDSLVARRSPAILAGVFASVALLLAAIGTYGVLSYAVGRRRREIGVRMALGAQPSQVRNQFLGMGLRLMALGIGLGAAGSWAAAKAMQAILYETQGISPVVLVLATATLGSIAVVACVLPANRATRVNPIEALRTE